ncbi:dihydropteroate synthase [Candidatus Contubernalis alkaliaceticus]|uniref:dihydropteroate synthase n=1 Tax=Candidatus Contubernalis alkaliaceticus TaxID=338645 RepID=UPI001F4C3323|nr:dihydropteroate synthase [Candidatus Contubernalis alkalaceticus]UNC90740.1 dihydropteroate synthase [Candidatus Contubernalis alkalaceticus]
MIIIGERVNATRKRIRTAIQQKDTVTIKDEIVMQDMAGAHYIDLNAGTGSGVIQQEKDDLCWLIDIALECTEKNLVLDAAGPEILQAAAKHLDDRRPWMLNSINGELSSRSMEIIELASKYQVPLIALAMDKKGIPPETDKRLAICEAILNEVRKRGLSEELIFFDPLVIPIATDTNQALVTFKTIERINELFPQVKTTLGLTNISHGLKKRFFVNGAFLTTAVCFGLHSAILDPTQKSIQQSVIMGNLLAGKDKFCRKFSRAIRVGLFEEEER